MIAVTGAAGKTGLALLRALALQEVPVRAVVRRTEQVGVVRRAGASAVAIADLRDVSALSAALVGVDKLYHICPNMQPDETEIGLRILDIAQRLGCHLVYHSVLHPQTEEMPHHWAKLRVEEAILRTDLSFTILQPAAYMQNIAAQWQGLLAEGCFRVPYDPSTRLNMVDLVDVAATAAIVLTASGHEGAIYELAGPETLSQTEVAAQIGSFLGRTICAEAVDRKLWADSARQSGLSAYAVETLLKMFRYYEQFGFFGNANVLRLLLGREPNCFADFLLAMGY